MLFYIIELAVAALATVCLYLKGKRVDRKTALNHHKKISKKISFNWFKALSIKLLWILFNKKDWCIGNVNKFDEVKFNLSATYITLNFWIFFTFKNKYVE